MKRLYYAVTNDIKIYSSAEDARDMAENFLQRCRDDGRTPGMVEWGELVPRQRAEWMELQDVPDPNRAQEG